ncbi:DegT/DnrJ/EryC1/StrS family aminotransferase [Mesobacillus subterraneus]|uniref:DegT/DnrJ/EryC1/StrS family aminotransferase n=1 Tax=Mesobacillus subterraneus TaxID=285983 RepID=UPI001CFED777|nr:DegT/DnrJ/EryC1/StrS family aminotransferase [Mesobacillus subterraneus]WLR55471.1 DegT/DnrJ/EryC1/StrS family aminotransferase [Mesobacillus subterraneus]
MKKIMVSKPALPPISEYTDLLEVIWNNNHLTNSGPLHQDFEILLKGYLKAEEVCLFTNGHLALEAALQVLNLTGEVITTPFTFASTAHAITRSGLKPVFCDIDPETYNIDVSKLEDLISDNTSAILAVHVFGTPCDIEGIEKIARKYNLKVIYDAAHAFGVTFKGRSISSYGDISMFSFHATKVFHSIEGGALVFNDKSLKRNLEKLKNFGIENEEVVDMVGFNAKMNEFQAAMGILNLKNIDETISKRREIVSHYNSKLESILEITVLKPTDHTETNYSYYPILLRSNKVKGFRNKVYTLMKEKNIFTRKYFYPLCTDFECYKSYHVNVPIAEDIASSVLVLPLYDSLSIEEVDYICDSIKESITSMNGESLN